MSNPTCFASLHADAIRVSKLTAAGAPLAGAGNGYVTDAIVSCQVAVDVNKGDEFTQKNGIGAVCQYFRACDTVKSLTLTLNLCQLDAQLISFLAATDLFSSGGNPIGFQYPSVEATCPAGICFEVWTEAWDGTQAAIPAVTSPNIAYWHWVFPNTQWQIGNINMENNVMVVPMTGLSLENSQITANGPFNDWPAGVGAGGGVTRVGGVFLDASLPTASCATIAVPSGS